MHAVGAGHSWSDVALTDGYLVEPDGIWAACATPTTARSPPRRPRASLARVGAGMHLHDLNAALDRAGLALPNMGGYDAPDDRRRRGDVDARLRPALGPVPGSRPLARAGHRRRRGRPRGAGRRHHRPRSVRRRVRRQPPADPGRRHVPRRRVRHRLHGAPARARHRRAREVLAQRGAHARHVGGRARHAHRGARPRRRRPLRAVREPLRRRRRQAPRARHAAPRLPRAGRAARGQAPAPPADRARGVVPAHLAAAAHRRAPAAGARRASASTAS